MFFSLSASIPHVSNYSSDQTQIVNDAQPNFDGKYYLHITLFLR